MLEDKVKELAKGRNFALVTTLMPDGTPQTLPLWVDADDDHVLINTEVGRQRYKNLQRNPKVTVLIVEDGNWYSFAEVRGHLDGEITGDEARTHIDALSHKYTGADYANPIQTERVVLKIAPDRQLVR